MEKRRIYKIIAFVALFVAVIGTSIGFASYSTSLQIKGSANVKAQSWDIKFNSIARSALSTATELTPPTIEEGSTIISGLSLQFNNLGDKAIYTFEAENAGTFNAELTSIVIGEPTCTGTGDNAVNDAANVCNHININVLDSNNAVLATGVSLTKETTMSGLQLVIEYDSDIPIGELANNDVSVTNISVTMTFGQS